jgi:hypothetical protein
MSSVQLAQDVYEAFGRGRHPGTRTLHTDMEWHPAEGHPSALTGPRGWADATEGFFAQIGAAWTNFTVTPHVSRRGDTVVVEAATGPLERIRADDRRAVLSHLDDARRKMRRFQQYMDTAQLQNAAVVAR